MTVTADNSARDKILMSLLERSDLWRVRQQEKNSKESYQSGYAELDQHLIDGGWPKQGICELFSSHVSQGLLSLFMPLLRQLIPANHLLSNDASQLQSAGSKLVAFISAPLIPFAPALLTEGLDINQLVSITPNNRKEQLWALEQCLSHGSCHLVFAWLDKLSASEARRLQLASEKGQSLGVIHLPQSQLGQSHAVTLKLNIEPVAVNGINDNSGNTLLGQQSIQIIKQRGGWPVPKFSLPLVTNKLNTALSLMLKSQPQQSVQSAVLLNRFSTVAANHDE